MKSNILKNLSTEQMDLSSRIFDLVIGRVLKRAYLDFDQTEKENMEKVFLLDDNLQEEKFIKKYIPNFKNLFNEEMKKIEEEIKAEIEKQT